MKTNTLLIKLVIVFSVILLLLFFGFMWYRSSNMLKDTRKQLLNAQATINSLQIDNQKLVEYITEKDKQVKQIEADYQEALNNIPADNCGDVKPSKELLQYFRRNK